MVSPLKASSHLSRSWPTGSSSRAESMKHCPLRHIFRFVPHAPAACLRPRTTRVGIGSQNVRSSGKAGARKRPSTGPEGCQLVRPQGLAVPRMEKVATLANAVGSLSPLRPGLSFGPSPREAVYSLAWQPKTRSNPRTASICGMSTFRLSPNRECEVADAT